MANQDQYFDYLMHRSRLSEMYRRHILYPRLSSRLIGSALDIGCGIGDMLAFRPDMVGVDVNERTVEYCKKRGLQAFVMLPDNLPFAAHEFDSALMDNVLEHIAKPDILLNEVHRVVSPGGRLLIGVPGILGWKSDSDHKIYYDESKLNVCVEKHGFTHLETFYSPIWKSEWFSKNLRQYCIYSAFSRRDQK